MDEVWDPKEIWAKVTHFLLPSRSILLFLVIGLVVRFALAPLTSWTEDIYPFYRTATDMLSGAGVYGHASFTYPPLFALILFPFVSILSLFVDPSGWGVLVPEMVNAAQVTGMLTPFVTSPAFNLTVKLPIIIADLLMGLLLYRFTAEVRDEVWAKRIFILWFLNPLVIWVSSISSQIDVFPAILTVMALMCFYRRYYFLTGLALGVGFLFKLYPSYLILFYILLLVGLQVVSDRSDWIRASFRNLAKMVFGGLVSLVTVLPFLLTSGSMVDFILRRSSSPNFGGFNLWFPFPYVNTQIIPPRVSVIYIDTSFLMFLGLIIITLVIGLVFIRMQGRIGSSVLNTLLLGNIMVIAAILLLQPVTNPQHFLWIFPFMLLLGSWQGRMERKVFLLTILGILYLVGLQSIEAVMYPAAVYTPLMDPSSLSESIMRFFNSGIDRGIFLLPITALGVVTIGSVFLPERYDPLELAYSRYRTWRCRGEM
jgi:hypothetical protein